MKDSHCLYSMPFYAQVFADQVLAKEIKVRQQANKKFEKYNQKPNYWFQLHMVIEKPTRLKQGA